MQSKVLVVVLAAIFASSVNAMPMPYPHATALDSRQNGFWDPTAPNGPILWEVDSIAVMPGGPIVGGSQL